MFPVSVSSCSASNDDYDDETLLKKLCLLLFMPQNASECTSEQSRVVVIDGFIDCNYLSLNRQLIPITITKVANK